jgi:hypothetical protein
MTVQTATATTLPAPAYATRTTVEELVDGDVFSLDGTTWYRHAVTLYGTVSVYKNGKKSTTGWCIRIDAERTARCWVGAPAPAGHFTLQGHRVEIAAARAVFGEILAAQWEGDNSFGVNLDTEVAYIDASDSSEYTVVWETLDEGANWTLYKTRGHGADAKDIIVSFARVTDQVVIADPDDPSGSPAFDGFVDEAHNALQAGIYDTTDGRRVIVNKWGSGLIGAKSIELPSGVYFLLDDEDPDNTFRNLGVMPGPDAYDDWTEIEPAGVGENEEPLLAAIAAALRPGGDIAAAIAADAAFTALHNS